MSYTWFPSSIMSKLQDYKLNLKRFRGKEKKKNYEKTAKLRWFKYITPLHAQKNHTGYKTLPYTTILLIFNSALRSL